jgi:uncharacterized protein YdeI (YjbR/CyaY-like superfamily)
MDEWKSLPVQSFASADELRAWLEEHHTTSQGLWIKIAKKGSGIPSVTYDEAVDAALCFGWIDGQKDAFDADYFLQRFTPRRPRSKWSEVNREKVARLTERGLMRPAGLREVEAAKADGRWDGAYGQQSLAQVPEDLQAALDANETAGAFFATLNRTNRYAILYHIADAKRPETRAKRIAKFVAMLAEGKTLHPQSPQSRDEP